MEKDNTMELKDVRAMDIKDPKESMHYFNIINECLEKYVTLGSEGELAFEITDPKAIEMWKKHIKPLSNQIKPLTDEMIALDEERAKLEETFKAHIEKMDNVKKQIDGIVLRRNKFITRISPMIVREYSDKINKFQQFGSIIEDNGKVFVTVKDWLASFVSGYMKKQINHDERVNNKISPKMATVQDEDTTGTETEQEELSEVTSSEEVIDTNKE